MQLRSFNRGNQRKLRERLLRFRRQMTKHPDIVGEQSFGYSFVIEISVVFQHDIQMVGMLDNFQCDIEFGRRLSPLLRRADSTVQLI
ncbi:hypothetical protein ACFTAO_23240 [Paenibacillus rhizoplanae]